MRAGVFTQENESVRVNPERASVTANERQGSPDVRQGILKSSEAAKSVVERKPVVSSAGKRFEDLSDVRDAAASLDRKSVV